MDPDKNDVQETGERFERAMGRTSDAPLRRGKETGREVREWRTRRRRGR